MSRSQNDNGKYRHHHADGLNFARKLMESLFDEGFCHSGYIFNGAIQPHGGIDAVCE